MSVYLCCCLALLVALTIQDVAGASRSAEKPQTLMSAPAETHAEKKSSSLKYIGLGKRTLPKGLPENLADTFNIESDKRTQDAYRYASLGKREGDDLYDYLTKRSGAFKYGSLGKRADLASQGSGLSSDKRGAGVFKYSSLGKRGNSAFRYSGLGKRGSNAFRYGSLGKRDTQDVAGIDAGWLSDQGPEYTHHNLGKRSASSREHDILAKRLGYAYKYASVGKREPVPPNMHKKWFFNSQPRSVSEPFQRRAAAFRYVGVGKRDRNPGIKYASLSKQDSNPGIKYASLGKRQSQWKYAGLGKRSVSQDALSAMLEHLLEEQANLMVQRDQSYSDVGQEALPGLDSDWSSWQ